MNVFYSSFHVVNCVLYNMYFISRVFIVPYAYTVVYVLPIQLLGCHNCNKRLHCPV